MILNKKNNTINYTKQAKKKKKIEPWTNNLNDFTLLSITWLHKTSLEKIHQKHTQTKSVSRNKRIQ